jgi:hypothetical protein
MPNATTGCLRSSTRKLPFVRHGAGVLISHASSVQVVNAHLLLIFSRGLDSLATLCYMIVFLCHPRTADEWDHVFDCVSVELLLMLEFLRGRLDSALAT